MEFVECLAAGQLDVNETLGWRTLSTVVARKSIIVRFRRLRN
jgi:hypothetical protein